MCNKRRAQRAQYYAAGPSAYTAAPYGSYADPTITYGAPARPVGVSSCGTCGGYPANYVCNGCGYESYGRHRHHRRCHGHHRCHCQGDAYGSTQYVGRYSQYGDRHRHHGPISGLISLVVTAGKYGMAKHAEHQKQKTAANQIASPSSPETTQRAFPEAGAAVKEKPEDEELPSYKNVVKA